MREREKGTEQRHRRRRRQETGERDGDVNGDGDEDGDENEDGDKDRDRPRQSCCPGLLWEVQRLFLAQGGRKLGASSVSVSPIFPDGCSFWSLSFLLLRRLLGAINLLSSPLLSSLVSVRCVLYIVYCVLCILHMMYCVL